MSKEIISHKTIITWTPTGVSVRDPKCPFQHNDGRVTYESIVDPGLVADAHCIKSTEKGPIKMGIWRRYFDEVSAYDTEAEAFGKTNGTPFGTDIIPLLDKKGERKGTVTVGPYCGIEGRENECNILSVTKAGQTEELQSPSMATVSLPTQTPVPTTVFGAEVGQPQQSPIEATFPPICAGGVVGFLGIAFLAVKAIQYLTGNPESPVR